jgi:uncharacterized protein (DUF2236 family)
MRDAGFIQDFAHLRVDAGIIAFPERAERIFVRIARATGYAILTVVAGLAQFNGVFGQFVDKVHIAIGAARETFAVFGFASWAEHC